ncbi:MAG: RNA polymerase sigma factor [Deltaproteobacteria bacterium]|nr:RNA polymerase sigma factor [Deltaproteobacteria bacterium]
MDEYPDSELIDLAVNGDEHAFEVLIQRHYLPVYHFSFKWCRSKEDAEEITQEVFIKLTRNLKSFKYKSSFRTWLFRIVINTAKDYSKKNSIRRSYESAYENEKISDNPGHVNEDTTDVDRLYFCIDRLPDKQKAALMLVVAEGLSHGEAAKVLKCREKTISWRIHQARNRLKAAFSRGF